jgi:CRP-like cAMP-binding protein
MATRESHTHPDAGRLAQIELFQGLTEDELARVAAWLDVEEFGPGQALAREGASGYAFFIRDEGSVRVQLEDGTTVMLEPGSVFGEMAFYGEARRNADVIAETHGRVLAMFGTRFREMQLALPVVAGRLEQLAQRRATEKLKHS